jgi:hypothetical protein
MDSAKEKIITMTVQELDALCQKEAEEAQARIEIYEERVAVQREHVDHDKTTTERAVEALERPERFGGEHDVARAWLKEHSTKSLVREFFQRRPA